MKYPKFLQKNDELVIMLTSNRNLLVSKECYLGAICTSDLQKYAPICKQEAISNFGFALKELRLLPLVEQEPTFDYPIYLMQQELYCCYVNKSSYFEINPKRNEIDCYYGEDLHLPKEKYIITKQEFLAACGDFIKKANLKEVFTILND